MAWCQTGNKPLPVPVITQFTDTDKHPPVFNELITYLINSFCSISGEFDFCHFETLGEYINFFLYLTVDMV